MFSRTKFVSSFNASVALSEDSADHPASLQMSTEDQPTIKYPVLDLLIVSSNIFFF